MPLAEVECVSNNDCTETRVCIGFKCRALDCRGRIVDHKCVSGFLDWRLIVGIIVALAVLAALILLLNRGRGRSVF